MENQTWFSFIIFEFGGESPHSLGGNYANKDHAEYFYFVCFWHVFFLT